MKKQLTITVLGFLALCSTASAAPREAGVVDDPMNSLNTYPITACFDLDRGTGQADWTGWQNGDPTPGYGHAYDNHSGTDWGMVNFTDLYAAFDAQVTWTRTNIPNDSNNNAGDPGNGVLIENTINGTPWDSLYYHMAYESTSLIVGDTITKGQKVGESDHTGHSTGPHLHFTTIKDNGSNTCGFYHGWYAKDEFYSQDGRPCLQYVKVQTGTTLNARRGTSTAYDIVTQVLGDQLYVACQRNGWYKVFVPMPPAIANESRDNAGSLATGYSETGSWSDSAFKSSVTDEENSPNKTLLTGSGTRSVAITGAGPAGTDATYTWTAPQRGTYEVLATWPSEANAAGVDYTVSDINGDATITLDQNGGTSGGDGSHGNPYLINSNPYRASHTTAGGEKIWDAYSPEGSGLDESGPERIYKFEVYNTTDITISVDHTGYPGLDVDVHLLDAMSNTNCIARADWTVSHSGLTPGTYYISIDTYGGDSAITPYDLTVEFATPQNYPNSWVSLGEYFLANGATGSVKIDASTVTGKADTSRAGAVFADAIKVVPVMTYRAIWASDFYLTVQDGATMETADGMGCVGVDKENSTNWNSNSIFDFAEVALYQSPGIKSTTVGESNSSAIVGKAVTGQRFVCDAAVENWYRVSLTNGTTQSQGWLWGDNLFEYRAPGSIPAAPTDAATQTINATSIVYSWTDNSDMESGYHVHVAQGATPPGSSTDTAAANAQSYTFSPATPNTQYSFKVVGQNGEGTSSDSATVTARTLAATPAAPSVTNPTLSSLDVTSGSDNNPAGTQYAIYCSTTSQWVQSNGTLGGSEYWSASWSTVTVTGLTANTSYSFQLKARNADSVETVLGSATAGTTDSATSVTGWQNL